MSADALESYGYVKQEYKPDLAPNNNMRHTSPHGFQQQRQQQQQQQQQPDQQQQQHQAGLDPYSQYKPYGHQPVDPFALMDGYRQDTATHASTSNEPSTGNSSNNGAFGNFPHIPGANGPLPIDRRGSIADNVVGSPASSYAPSLGPDTRHNSLANVHYPQLQQQFKIPGNVALDRRMSSPAAMHQQTAYAAAATNAQSRLLARSNVMPDQSAQWTPNFSFGGGSSSTTGTDTTAQNPNTGMGAIPEHFVHSSYASQQPRGTPAAYPSSFASLQGYNTDRRMSVPVLPSGSFQTSPNARVSQRRNVPSVDWAAMEGGISLTQQSQAPPPPSRQDYHQRDTSAPYLEAMPGQRGIPGNTSLGAVPTASAPYDHMKSQLHKRRQSLPFFPPDQTLQTMQPDGSGGLSQPPNSMLMDETQQIPQQQSMMTTFHAKDENASHKKHVCPVCKKRFTRPSSLTTHIYSHTGEKPFVCEVPGCGRHFSVISNLRRHKKIHQNDGEAASGEDEGEGATQPASQPSF
jgi:hypothetical protein